MNDKHSAMLAMLCLRLLFPSFLWTLTTFFMAQLKPTRNFNRQTKTAPPVQGWLVKLNGNRGRSKSVRSISSRSSHTCHTQGNHRPTFTQTTHGRENKTTMTHAILLCMFCENLI